MIALLDRVADRDQQLGAVRIQGGDAAAVVYDDVVAVAGMLGRYNDLAGLRRINIRADRRGNVDAAVEVGHLLAVNVVSTVAIAAADAFNREVARPDELAADVIGLACLGELLQKVFKTCILLVLSLPRRLILGGDLRLGLAE